MNPFTNPKLSRELILERNLVTYNTSSYMGKSIIYVFFTRHCGVGCPFCFFKSAPAEKVTTIEDEFDDEGIDKFIEFANKSNLGYLAISGGGEPMNMRTAILRSIEEIETNAIVMNTSGSWAMNEKAANKYIDDMFAAWQRRASPCKVVVRVSVSEGHSIKLGIKPALNLIKIFRERFNGHPYFKLGFHTFSSDSTLSKILKEFPEASLSIDPSTRASASDLVLKIIPKKTVLTFPDGYSVVVGLSRVFTSGLRPDLNKPENLEQGIAVFQEDLEFSEDFFPTVVENYDGSKGIDWAINYNGNVCAWTNQVNDNQFNIYQDSYEQTLEKTFSDPLALSIIENGTEYRDAIVAEADPRAVLRLRAIGLRDYSGTVLFEEEKTRLYFTLRVLQDYVKKERVIFDELDMLPGNIRNLILGSKEELLEAYHAVHHTIIHQYKREEFDQIKWRDLFELIKLNHYTLSKDQIDDALDYYNERATASIESLDQVEYELGSVERRLTERLMHIKPLSRPLERRVLKSLVCSG